MNLEGEPMNNIDIPHEEITIHPNDPILKFNQDIRDLIKRIELETDPVKRLEQKIELDRLRIRRHQLGIKRMEPEYHKAIQESIEECRENIRRNETELNKIRKS